MAERDVRRRPGGRAARVRQAVTRATLEAMAEHGLVNLTVSDIAARAGVHQTSVYRRWGSRENLIVETLLDYSEERIPIPDTGSVRTDLHQFLGSVLGYLTTPLGRSLAQAMVIAGDEPGWAKVRAAFWTARLDRAGAIIDRGIARDELPGGTNPRLILETLVAPLHFRTLVTREALTDALSRTLTDLVLDGARSHHPATGDTSPPREKRAP